MMENESVKRLVNANASWARIALESDKVYKDECVYSFDTPESDGGLFVSLSSFLGFSREFVSLNFKKTKEPLYLHVQRRELPAAPSVEAPPAKKPTRLAIGIEGGFDGGITEKKFEEKYTLAVLPEFVLIPLPDASVPQNVQDSIASVVAAKAASRTEAIACWEGDRRKESKHSLSLKQLDNGAKVPPSGWKCAECELTSNLWLNLTDGSILCGRRYFDGSGGNNHAAVHYEETRFPLAVKLGTITPEGADVYSYDEDEMVLDTRLAHHLSHFGINCAVMRQTDATMTELEIDMNLRIGEWSLIQESGEQLVPLYGPGYTGLLNLGNSCYLNSVMQVVFSLPDFQKRYFDVAEQIFDSAPANPTDDFEAQMSKLAAGLLSGGHSCPAPGDKDAGVAEGQKGISPRMFKALIGRGHVEFSTNRQQDAQEFFLYLLESIERDQHKKRSAEAVRSLNCVDCFRYKVEERVQCVVSGKVRYTSREDKLLTLPVPMEASTNKDEVEKWAARKKELEAKKERINQEQVIRAILPFQKCLEKFSCPVEVPDFYSSAVKAKSAALKTTRFATFPDYLMIQMSKFALGDDWVPMKYDVLIDAPEELDLSHLRACGGLQPGEEELPDLPPAPVPVELDEGVVAQLVSMGFGLEGCRRAVFHTHNQGVEPAMNWILEHMEDADFLDPFHPPTPTQASHAAPAAEAVAMVMALGFTRDQSLKALKETGNSVERAADWLFSHTGEIESCMDASSQGPQYRDGVGKYKLVAFISHMGTSTMCGHYVCHVKKEGRWVIFNDDKVALSKALPIQLAYLYLYARTE